MDTKPPQPIFTVYRTTCLPNGKVYIGVHKTTNPQDNYIGSGNLLCAAVERYGRNAFRKEVLFEYTSKKEAYEKERSLVDEAFVKRADTYNLMIGGVESSGWYRSREGRNNNQFGKVWVCTESEEKLVPPEKAHTFVSSGWALGRLRSSVGGTPPDSTGKVFIHHPTGQVRLLPEAEAQNLLSGGWVKGKPQKLSEKGRETLRKNAQNVWSRRDSSPTKGRTWVHFGTRSKMVLLEEIDPHLAEGWVLGMSPATSEVRKTHTGEKSSQKGKFWVVREGSLPLRVVGEEELSRHLKEGWSRGKILRKKVTLN